VSNARTLPIETGNGDCFALGGAASAGSADLLATMPLLHPHDMKRAWLRRRAKAKAKMTIRKTSPASSGARLRRLPPRHPRRDDADRALAATVNNEPATAANEVEGDAAEGVAYPPAC